LNFFQNRLVFEFYCFIKQGALPSAPLLKPTTLTLQQPMTLGRPSTRYPAMPTAQGPLSAILTERQ
jgi:hypothetical protein